MAVCVHVCMSECVDVPACDAQDIHPTPKPPGSTFLHFLQVISETKRPEFFRPRWQAIHRHTDSQLWDVGASSGAARQAGPGTSHPTPAANCSLNHVSFRDAARPKRAQKLFVIVMCVCVCVSPGGGDPSVLDANYPPN